MATASLPLLDHVHGFAEVFPEDKHAIVTALQKRHFIVGMTGDGVNDAPALKQAEVGVAVSNATDVAKRSASAIMMKDGLSGILDMIVEGRQIHGRLTTWLMTYIIKTWQQSVFVMLIYWIRGSFPVGSIHLLVLIIFLDGVTLSLSTDQTRFPQQPSRWRLIRLVSTCASIGFFNLLELIGGYYYALKVSDNGYEANLGLLQTFCFIMLLSFTLLSIITLRDRDFFFRSRPSWQLAAAIIIDYAVATVLASVGAPFISIYRISGWDQGLILLYALVTRFFINDPIKVLLFRFLLPEVF